MMTVLLQQKGHMNKINLVCGHMTCSRVNKNVMTVLLLHDRRMSKLCFAKLIEATKSFGDLTTGPPFDIFLVCGRTYFCLKVNRKVMMTVLLLHKGHMNKTNLVCGQMYFCLKVNGKVIITVLLLVCGQVCFDKIYMRVMMTVLLLHKRPLTKSTWCVGT